MIVVECDRCNLICTDDYTVMPNASGTLTLHICSTCLADYATFLTNAQASAAPEQPPVSQ